MPSSLTTVLAVAALALDPILEAARAQQDKEHVIDFFAAARARELKQLRASVAVEREEAAAAANATAAKLMGELKDASGKFWKEHAARLNAETALRDHAATLRNAEAKGEKPVNGQRADIATLREKFAKSSREAAKAA